MKRSSAAAAPAAAETLYDADFFEWTRRTAALLRARRFQGVDIEHAAEEIEDLGKRDLKELNSRVQVLLMHLFKWKLQPKQRSPSWRRTIATQRVEIDDLLQTSPSLRSQLAKQLSRNYQQAIRRAVGDTGLSHESFAEECPFTVPQALDDSFLPD